MRLVFPKVVIYNCSHNKLHSVIVLHLLFIRNSCLTTIMLWLILSCQLLVASYNFFSVGCVSYEWFVPIFGFALCFSKKCDVKFLTITD
jgi:hypothetical protein